MTRKINLSGIVRFTGDSTAFLFNISITPWASMWSLDPALWLQDNDQFNKCMPHSVLELT